MKKKQKILFITITLAAVAFFGVRYQVSQPIECAHGRQVTPETEVRDAAKKETFWHKVFLTRSECRKLTREEAIFANRGEMWSPD